MRRDSRRLIAPLGEYDEDLLKIYARLTADSLSSSANALLCGRLREEERLIRDRVRYLANKNNVSFEVMWDQLLNGEGDE